ncbi:MAG: lipopolysaccharide biosynthesis protein [Acidobacteriia bacterium]|nr:lipopolysaccharide biosynthesis protein [Terriglobia bacterium]
MTTISIEETVVLSAASIAPPRGGARFSNRRAYAQTFAATAAIRCLGVVSGVLAARLLGPAGRGELAVIIFLPMLLVPLGELELPRSLAYEVSRLEEVPRAVIATSFWLAAGLGLMQAALLAGLLPLYLPADKLHLLGASRWFMVYLPATLITATLLGSDQGRGRFGRFSALLALPGALYVAAIVAAWASGHVSPAVFAAGLLAATLVVCGVRTRMDWGAISPRLADWTTARRLLQRGWSFYLPTVASIALYRADMFILVRLAPSEAIGLYAVAQAIALGQIGAVSPFIQVGFSAVAGETEPRQALQTLARHFRLAQLAVIGVGLVAAAATPWLVRLMFGAKFTGAVTTAYLLIGATVVWGMEQVLEQGLRAAGHPRPGIVSNLLGLGVLVGVGIPACVRYGIIGLASAALGAQFLNLAVVIGFCVARLKMTAKSFWALDASAFKEIGTLVRAFINRIHVRPYGAS